METVSFTLFQETLYKHFQEMAAGKLFRTSVTKDKLWDTYLESFPEGTNKIYKERREYDCQCCRQFIRACGNTVTIENGKLVSIWDIQIGGYYQVVVDALAKLVKSKPVSDAFLHDTTTLGTKQNHSLLENKKTITWNHFYFNLPAKFVNTTTLGTELSRLRANKEVLKRGLEELSAESAETIVELIEQGSLYRGEEHLGHLQQFILNKKTYTALSSKKKKDLWCWTHCNNRGIRNTVIGSLLIDLNDGDSLESAVRKFESKVAPENYKRPTALITASMIKNAQKKVEELDIKDSLSRRHARISDITINNVLFADRAAKKHMDVFDELAVTVKPKVDKFDKVEEVQIDDFLKNILPKADKIELMLDNKHTGNLMTLVAPENREAKSILKWPNNFSWVYNGGVADSMKQRVKSAGGKVDGVLRFSIQWNDGDNNQNDFDAHCIEPCGNLIDYCHMKNRTTLGNLDVDVVTPGNKIAVENITWPDINKMLDGQYRFLVHNFSHNGGKTGFTAEIEYDGVIHSYAYDKELRHGEKVTVAVLDFNKQTGIKFIESLPSNSASKEAWGISTNQFHNVRIAMLSPNHWDGNKEGNKHYFFILDKCANEQKVRGFFNEYLNNELTEHRKVFEVLGNKMQAEVETDSEKQLSGLGFSSTNRNDILCRVSGSFNRVIKLKF